MQGPIQGPLCSNKIWPFFCYCGLRVVQRLCAKILQKQPSSAKNGTFAKSIKGFRLDSSLRCLHHTTCTKSSAQASVITFLPCQDQLFFVSACGCHHAYWTLGVEQQLQEESDAGSASADTSPCLARCLGCSILYACCCL